MRERERKSEVRERCVPAHVTISNGRRGLGGRGAGGGDGGVVEGISVSGQGRDNGPVPSARFARVHGGSCLIKWRQFPEVSSSASLATI